MLGLIAPHRIPELVEGPLLLDTGAMTFRTYMLHCRGGAFYVGHTDNIDIRVAQHQSRALGGFTSERLPVKLVWSEAFQSRDQAKAAEKQIKGWSRAKKMALIRGDWDAVSFHARNSELKGKDGPSTGSGMRSGAKL